MTMTPTNQMTTVQGPGSLLVRAFRFVLNYLLIELFDLRLVKLNIPNIFALDIFSLKYFSSFKLRILIKFAIH